MTSYCLCNPEAFGHLPEPLFRLICHCHTCQAFFGHAANDECSFHLKDLPGLRLDNIAFKSYQPLSPIQRGSCKSCGKVAVCMAKLGPFLHLVMIPSALTGLAHLPPPVAHIYYHRRVQDATDQAPKISGPILSQLTIGFAVFRALFKPQPKSAP